MSEIPATLNTTSDEILNHFWRRGKTLTLILSGYEIGKYIHTYLRRDCIIKEESSSSFSR